MTAGAVVVVQGHAVVPGEPDLLELAFSVSAGGDSADDALAEAARLSDELASLLGELAVPAAARSTSGVSVREEFERNEGRWLRRGYRATNHVVVRLDAPETAGRLMSEAVARSQARVDGPRWRFRLENPARVEACRQAAADARRKAEAYAAALGMRLGPVLRVAEPGADHGGESGELPPMIREGPGPSDMQIQAGRLDVAATVEVTFALEPA